MTRYYQQHRLGGLPEHTSKTNNYGEITFDIHPTDPTFIFFTKEACVANFHYLQRFFFFKHFLPAHPNVPLLEAVYIQQTFQQQTQQAPLPIYEYSTDHNRLTPLESITDDDIVGYWKDLCEHFKNHVIDSILFRAATSNLSSDVSELDIDDLKSLACYHSLHEQIFQNRLTPLDQLYSDSLKTRINAFFQSLKTQLMEIKQQKIIDKLQTIQCSSLARLSKKEVTTLMTSDLLAPDRIRLVNDYCIPDKESLASYFIYREQHQLTAFAVILKLAQASSSDASDRLRQLEATAIATFNYILSDQYRPNLPYHGDVIDNLKKWYAACHIEGGT